MNIQPLELDWYHYSTLNNVANRCRHNLRALDQPPNSGLQLRRAISIQADGKRLLANEAIAPASCEALFGGVRMHHLKSGPKTIPIHQVAQETIRIKGPSKKSPIKYTSRSQP